MRINFFVHLSFLLCTCVCLFSGSDSWAQGIDICGQGQLGCLNPEGMTVQTRFHPPFAYFRKDYGDPYAEYMRNLPLLPHNSPVLLHTGEPKENQAVHVAVLDIDVGKRNLQNCSDAAQRLRAEYLYATHQWNKISYHLSNGFLLSYNDWRAGYRLKREGKKTWMHKSAKPSDSYESFRAYLDALFTYAGVNSVMAESSPIALHEMQPGDVFAATGHLIIVLDVVENIQGNKMFLLAQSFIPAQEIQTLMLLGMIYQTSASPLKHQSGVSPRLDLICGECPEIEVLRFCLHY